MKILSSLEIKAVVEELQSLIGSKVDQIYQPDNEEIVISLHKTGLGKHLLRIISGTALYITSVKKPSPKEQINFCRFLRKRLGSTRLKEIIQNNFERIVELHFEGKESYFILITEFFSKGNIILCDKDYNIISALQVQLWKDRKIKAKVKYEYPPARKTTYDNYESFYSFIKSSQKENIVKTLALGLNLGGVYAEELCSRANIEKTSKTPTDEEIKSLYNELNQLLKEPLDPNMINGEPFPIKMHSLGEKFETFNKALDKYYSQFIVIEEISEELKINKYNVMLEEQEKQLQEIYIHVDENKIKGEYIYNHYMELKELLDLFHEKKVQELKKRGIEIEGKNILVEI